MVFFLFLFYLAINSSLTLYHYAITPLRHYAITPLYVCLCAEILLKMAQSLGSMVPNLVPASRSATILKLLESLSSVEETVVRDAAVKSLNVCVSHLSSATDVPGVNLVDMLKRLCDEDWFTGRVSAAGVFKNVYVKAGKEGREQLRKLYKTLAEDDAPMVRRSAASNFSDFASVVESSFQSTDMLDIYRHLSLDEQDSVRQLVVPAAISVAKVVGDCAENMSCLFPIVMNSFKDKSWRVRHSAAKNYSELSNALQCGQQDPSKEIIDCYLQLLTDTEAEVRGASAANVARMADFVGEDIFVSTIVPILNDLSKDPVMEVRSKLSAGIMDSTNHDVCAKLSDVVILDNLRPIIEGMLKNDEESDEVKINILSRLPLLSRVLSKMDEIVGVVKSLARYELNWRVRECVANILPSLAEAYGIETFTAQYLPIYMSLLQDQVADVRSACVRGAYKLYHVACTDKDGAAWVTKNILGPTKELYDKSPFYLTRVTVLNLYSALCPDDATPKQLLEDVVVLLLRALNDPVPNVRFVSARCLLNVVPFCDDNIINATIKPQTMAAAEKRDISKVDEMDEDHDLREYLRKLTAVMEA